MRLERIVRTDKPLERVFGYLSDFTTTSEWDPGTVHTVRSSGDGGVGTEYRNTSRFAGRTTELTYTVVECEEGRRIALRGRNRTVRTLDTMVFERTADGTEVHYRAEFDFGPLTPVVGLVMRPFFIRLGDEAEQGMREALARL